MTAKKITILADPIETIAVDLVGKTYQITPPKTAYAMRISVESKLYNDDPTKMIEVLDGWITRAFGAKGSKDIQKRLDDEKDPIDLPHIMQLIEQVMEYQMEDDTPTT